ncbi:hypothetical protein BH18ACT17_BH18ACT17_03200 [soil metagenome]
MGAMSTSIGTAARPQNSLGVVAGICAVSGAANTFVLWLYQQRPSSPRSCPRSAAPRSPLPSLRLLLGAFALTLPVLAYFDVVQAPIRVWPFPGS